jgi:hypothetical protein
MPVNTTKKGLIGIYDTPDVFIKAAERVRDAGFKKWDCHTPYPVHGLDEAMGLKSSPVPFLVLTLGLAGAVMGFVMQWWMSAIDYPILVGGKPMNSWPAFVPITFEVFVLFAALTAMGCVIVLGRLGKWSSPLYKSGAMAEVTSHRFGIAIGADDENYDDETARKLLEESGCEDIRILEDE